MSEDLLTLTDEELALLGAEHPVVVAPYWEQLDDVGRGVAVEVARRSLRSHGVASKAGALVLPDGLVALLRLRSASARILLLIKQIHGVETTLYVHTTGQSVVLLETVSADGLHEFAVSDDLPAAIAPFVALEGLPAGRGEPIEVAPSGGIPPEPWGALRHQIDATVWRPGHPPGQVLAVLAGDGGVWTTTSRDAGPFWLAPTSPDQAVAAIAGLLTATP